MDRPNEKLVIERDHDGLPLFRTLGSMSGGDLSGLPLGNTDFRGLDLSETDLSDADLHRAILS